jgi:phage repressor protein C with HTH and peptisase S24 domain
MTINERMQFIVDKKFNGNKAAFAKALGIAPTSISNYLSKSRASKPTSDILGQIVNIVDDVNALWLLTGNGTPFSNTEPENDDKPQISFTKGVPYYNVDFIGGFDIVLNDQTIIPEYLIDFKKYNDATCWCNVTGHSMEPEITHGDIIALKKIEDKSFLPLGEVYAIVTTNGMRTIKRLGPSSDPKCYTLVPTNKSPEYGIQELPKDMIEHIYQVLGCMKRL